MYACFDVIYVRVYVCMCVCVYIQICTYTCVRLCIGVSCGHAGKHAVTEEMIQIFLSEGVLHCLGPFAYVEDLPTAQYTAKAFAHLTTNCRGENTKRILSRVSIFSSRRILQGGKDVMASFCAPDD